MPIYEYECSECGVFEAIQKPSDKPLKAQPDCPHKKCPRNAERIISQSSFHLKGGGWYKTDYAASGTSGAGGKKSKSASAESSKTESTTAESSTSDSTTTEKKSLKVKGGGGGGCGSGCGCH